MSWHKMRQVCPIPPLLLWSFPMTASWVPHSASAQTHAHLHDQCTTTVLHFPWRHSFSRLLTPRSTLNPLNSRGHCHCPGGRWQGDGGRCHAATRPQVSQIGWLAVPVAAETEQQICNIVRYGMRVTGEVKTAQKNLFCLQSGDRRT